MSLFLLLALLAFPGLSRPLGAQGEITQDLAADVLPLTPEFDRLRVLLVRRPQGWTVSAIHPASIGTTTPEAPQPLLRRMEVAHLRFVLSDLDADDDLDVIVVNRYSGAAQSVWLNHGAGPLERLRTDRFGKLRFPDDMITRAVRLSPCRARCLAGCSVVWVSPATTTAPYMAKRSQGRELESWLPPGFSPALQGRSPPFLVFL